MAPRLFELAHVPGGNHPSCSIATCGWWRHHLKAPRNPRPILEPPGLDPETRARILDRVPLGEWGSPEAVAKALLFILESDYLCGETITVDGGRTVG